MMNSTQAKIKVAVRVRPMLGEEALRGHQGIKIILNQENNSIQ